MQIVIDIPEEIKQKRDAGKVLSNEEISTVCMAIKNGTPLPKGHGCLIDQDALIGKIHGARSITAVLDAPVIIEADRGDAE